MGGRCWAARSALTALLASQHCRQPCIAVAASAQAAAATPATARGLASTTARLQPLSGIRCVDGAAQQAMPQRQLWRACQPHLSMPGLHTLTGVAAAVGASAPALADAHDACGGAARARNVALLAASAVAGAAVLVGGGVLADSPKQERSSEQPGVSADLNHPFDVPEAVTNEHTAQMTMARSAALEYYKTGKFKLAEVKFLEALEQAKLGFDAKDPHIASCQNNLAEFYRNTKQYDKAEPLYQEALALLDLIYGEKHWLYVGAMHNLALMYESAGRYDAAATTMSKVLKLRLQMFGDRSFLYADSMFAMAHITRKQGGRGSPQRTLQLMRKAITILEDMESVQVNVLLFWLQDYAAELRSQKRPAEAASAIAKAIEYMGSDKGATLAAASALSDQLVTDLLAAGKLQDARAAMAACLAAREELFSRDLVVVQSMAKLASIDAMLAQESALKHANGAVELARELIQEYKQAPTWASWLAGGGNEHGGARAKLRRVRASYLLGSALRQLATVHTELPAKSGGGGDTAAEPHLRAALVALQDAAAQAREHLAALGASSPVAPAPAQPAGASGSGPVPGEDELSTLYLEAMLGTVDCYERLAQAASARGDTSGATALLAQCEEVCRQLV